MLTREIPGSHGLSSKISSKVNAQQETTTMALKIKASVLTIEEELEVFNIGSGYKLKRGEGEVTLTKDEARDLVYAFADDLGVKLYKRGWTRGGKDTDASSSVLDPTEPDEDEEEEEEIVQAAPEPEPVVVPPKPITNSKHGKRGLDKNGYPK
jgi:hypothetical protein